jgi:hypothetical protein
VLYGNTTGAILVTAQGATNSVLIANAGAPSFSATPTVTSLTTTGAATVGGLTDLSGAGAGQVKFPATQNASSNANTLDDYEEGTWTPIDSSGASLTFAFASGSYTKVGQLVFVSFQIVYPATANGANALIGGLPFTANAATNYALSIGYETGGPAELVAYVNGGATTVTPALVGAGTTTNASLSNSNIIYGGAYFV